MNFIILVLLSFFAFAAHAGDYYLMLHEVGYSVAGPYESDELPGVAVCKVPMNGDRPYLYDSLTKEGDGITPDCDAENPATVDGTLHAAVAAELALIPQRLAAIQVLKEGLVSKTWDQMSVAERKVATGQTPTDVELGLE